MNDLIYKTRVTGKIEIDGQDIYDPKVDVVQLRSAVGMVFQKPNPFPTSIFDNVAYGPRAHGIKDKKKLTAIVEKSLRQSALWDEVKNRVVDAGASLSGDQRQRIGVTRRE